MGAKIDRFFPVRRLLHLILADLKNIIREPILLVVFVAPIMIILAMRFLFPFLSYLVEHFLEYDVTVHYRFAAGFMLLLTPMLFGFVSGFLILDERDQGLLLYYSITPITKSGFLLFRLTLPVIISFCITFTVIRFSGMVPFSFFSLLPIALLAGLEAPILCLFIGSFAANKVEGLALAKGIGILLFAPFVTYLVGEPWTIVFGLFPPYWVTLAFLESVECTWKYWFYILSGLVIHILYLVLFIRHFIRRAG